MKYDARDCYFNMDTDCVELLLRDGRKFLSTAPGSRMHWMSLWHSGLNWTTSSIMTRWRMLS